MRSSISVSEVRFSAAPEHLIPTGMLGWTSFLIDDWLRVDGVTLRRTSHGRLCLSYPSRDEGASRRWEYFRPIDDTSRREIERQVFEQLRLQGVLP